MGHLTKTGIPPLPEVARGTHLCVFYQSPEDLLEILVPYVKTGLLNNELCVVVRNRKDDFSRAEFETRLRADLPELDRFIAKGALEFVDTEQVYGGIGRFDVDVTRQFWRRKSEHAVRAGFAALRINGDEAWLQSRQWKDFIEYEHTLAEEIADLPAVMLCAYAVAHRTAAEVLDAAHAHQAVLAKRGGVWDVLEMADVAEAKQQLQRLRADLERRVLERTQELTAANERLKAEIAERTRVERALRESDERFVKAFRLSPLMMAIARYDDGRIFEVNDAFLRTYGYDRAEVIGRSTTELGLWADASQRESVMSAMAADGALHGHELSVRTKSGALLDLLMFAEPLELAGERWVLSAAYDQTARKKSEQAVLEQQLLLEQAERLSHTGSWQWRPRDGRMVWSKELYRIHGQAAETFTPSYEAWLALVHPQDRAVVKAAIDQCVANRSSFSVEHRIVRPDGETRYLRSAGYCENSLSDTGQRLTGYATDITHQRQAEQALRAARQELEALSRKLVQVQEAERNALSRELHDRVGQNLTAMGISLDLVRARLEADHGVAHRDELLGRLEDAAVLLEAIVGSVENLVSELRPPILDELGVGPAIEWYAAEFATRTGIHIRIPRFDPIPRLAEESELALFRIVQEALTNVAKHARARVVELSCRSTADAYVLSICDDGVGPPDAGAPKGNEPGFGLAIMRERALAVGGTFEFVARPAGGACAIVRLPVRPLRAPATA